MRKWGISIGVGMLLIGSVIGMTFLFQEPETAPNFEAEQGADNLTELYPRSDFGMPFYPKLLAQEILLKQNGQSHSEILAKTPSLLAEYHSLVDLGESAALEQLLLNLNLKNGVELSEYQLAVGKLLSWSDIDQDQRLSRAEAIFLSFEARPFLSENNGGFYFDEKAFQDFLAEHPEKYAKFAEQMQETQLEP